MKAKGTRGGFQPQANAYRQHKLIVGDLCTPVGRGRVVDRGPTNPSYPLTLSYTPLGESRDEEDPLDRKCFAMQVAATSVPEVFVARRTAMLATKCIGRSIDGAKIESGQSSPDDNDEPDETLFNYFFPLIRV